MIYLIWKERWGTYVEEFTDIQKVDNRIKELNLRKIDNHDDAINIVTVIKGEELELEHINVTFTMLK